MCGSRAVPGCAETRCASSVRRLVTLARDDVDTFLAASKTLSGQMRWISRPTADYATLAVEMNAVEAGQLIAVQLTAAPRFWKFRLDHGGTEVLCWHFRPEGDIRSHRNPSPRPDGFPKRDTSLIHEHPWIDGHETRCSRPLDGLETASHEQAFSAFCARANIDPGATYRQPPEPQLSLIR